MSTIWIHNATKDYDWTKVDGEMLVNNSRVKHMIIRPGFIYGPGDLHHLPLFRLVKRLGMFTPIIGNGENYISPIYIDDLVKVLAEPAEGTIDVCSQCLSTPEFLAAIAQELGHRTPRIKVPWVPLKFRDMTKYDFFAVNRPCPILDNPTPLKEGIKRTIAWYRENGYL